MSVKISREYQDLLTAAYDDRIAREKLCKRCNRPMYVVRDAEPSDTLAVIWLAGFCSTSCMYEDARHRMSNHRVWWRPVHKLRVDDGSSIFETTYAALEHAFAEQTDALAEVRDMGVGEWKSFAEFGLAIERIS